jgi:hypothetical protein
VPRIRAQWLLPIINSAANIYILTCSDYNLYRLQSYRNALIRVILFQCTDMGMIRRRLRLNVWRGIDAPRYIRYQYDIRFCLDTEMIDRVGLLFIDDLIL